MTPRQVAWVKLGALLAMTGCGYVVAAIAGGCKLWIAIMIGVAHAGESIYHALSDSPNDPKVPTT
jgi:hypothetical protein